MNIVISYGPNNTVSRPASDFPTVNSILGSAVLKQFLGFGSNVEARVNGITVASDYALSANDNVELITKANSKA
jgi:hypothetical protein